MKKAWRFVYVILLLMLLIGCGSPVITSVEPPSGSSTGLYEATIHGRNFARDGNEVRVGGIRAVGVEVVNRRTIRAILQGSPVPGPADVELHNTVHENGFTLAAGFTFDPPVDSAFDRMYGLGASLSTGIQSNSLSFFTQTVGPMVQIAKQAGAYIGLPLVLFEGVPGNATARDVHIGHDEEVWDPIIRKWVLVPEGVLYNPAWEIRDNTLGIIGSVLPVLLGNPPYPLAGFRLDPFFQNIRNLSIPSAWLTDALLGEKIGLSLFGHILYDPCIPLKDALITPSPSQILNVVNSDPTIVLSLDLYGIDASLLTSEQVDPEVFESVLFLALLDLSTSHFYCTPGLKPGYQSIPFIVKPTGRRIQNPFLYHVINPYNLIVDYEALGLPNFGDLNANGRIDPDEVDLAAVLQADDPGNNPYGVFIANIPDPEIAPSGEGSGNSELASALNDIFGDLAGRFDNVHVVDVESLFDRIRQEANGEIALDVLDVDHDGTQDLYLQRFGGLFSLDGLHLTETGYAFYANLCIRKINETLGTNVPEINAAEVFAQDPLASRNFSDEALDYVGVPHK